MQFNVEFTTWVMNFPIVLQFQHKYSENISSLVCYPCLPTGCLLVWFSQQDITTKYSYLLKYVVGLNRYLSLLEWFF